MGRKESNKKNTEIFGRKNVPLYYIRVTEGKIEKRRQNEDKHLNFYLHNTLCLPDGVHKI